MKIWESTWWYDKSFFLGKLKTRAIHRFPETIRVRVKKKHGRYASVYCRDAFMSRPFSKWDKVYVKEGNVKIV